MTPTTKRVALYARTSTTDKGQDPQLQLEDLRRLATQRRWTVAAEHIDQGVSGAKVRRPALDQLMAEARQGKLDVVAVWRFDRFARSTQHLLAALEEFRTLGVDFVSMRENLDTTTAMGRAMFTITAAVAELEREIIRERVRAGIAKRKADGLPVGRQRVEFDLRPALALLREGRPLREAAAILDVSRATLRRRLQEADHWPVQGVVQKPRGAQSSK